MSRRRPCPRAPRRSASPSRFSNPSLSRRLGETGRVVLRVLVTTGGAAERVELRTSSGSTRLDTSALETVQRWKFIPAKLGDTPVSAWVLVPIVFTLEG